VDFENQRILCQATVDKLADFTWEVYVWGQTSFDQTRTYTLNAKDDNSAALEGIRIFTEEMENLRDADSKE
jgi:hypothetical protein